jgi:hypothetical protein
MSRLIVLAYLLTALIPAHAQELCMSCSEPVASYRCSVEQPSEKMQIGGKLAEEICSKVMEKKGGHAKCHVARIAAGDACDGPARTVTVTDYQRAIAGSGESTYEPGALEIARRNVQSGWVCVTSLFQDC